MSLLAEPYCVDGVTMHSYDLSFIWFSSRCGPEAEEAPGS
jgi:hypothetical protein